MGVEQGQRCNKAEHEDDGCNIQTNTKLGCPLNQHTLQNISPSLNILLIHLFSFVSAIRWLLSVRWTVLHKCTMNSNNQILKGALEQLDVEVALDEVHVLHASATWTNNLYQSCHEFTRLGRTSQDIFHVISSVLHKDRPSFSQFIPDQFIFENLFNGDGIMSLYRISLFDSVLESSSLSVPRPNLTLLSPFIPLTQYIFR